MLSLIVLPLSLPSLSPLSLATLSLSPSPPSSRPPDKKVSHFLTLSKSNNGFYPKPTNPSTNQPISVTSLGFFEGLAVNFFTKVAQIFGNYFANLKIITFK